EPDDRQIAGNVEAQMTRRFDHSEGLDIGTAEDRGRSFGLGQQLDSELESRLAVVGAVADVSIVDIDAGGKKRGAVPLLSFGARYETERVVGPVADKSDATMVEPDQVV